MIQICQKKKQKKIYLANIDQKKTGVAILTQNKTDLEKRKSTKDKEEHYIIGSI